MMRPNHLFIFPPFDDGEPQKRDFGLVFFLWFSAFDITPEGGTHNRKGSVQRAIRLSLKDGAKFPETHFLRFYDEIL